MLPVSKSSRILSTVVLFYVLTDVVSAQDQPGDPTLQLWRQSVEHVIVLDAAPEPFQAFVGEDFKVVVKEEKTWLLIVLQDSQTNYLDGEDVGPSQDVHIWVKIEGPREGTEIPVIGAPTTFETMSWFKLFGGSSHPQVRSMFATSGLLYEPIEKLSLVHSDREIGGELVVDQDKSFSWRAKPKAPSAELLGVNHDFYTRNQDGRLVCTQVQALVKVRAWASEGALEIRGGIVPGNLLPAGTYPVTVNSYDPIWIRASINVPVPE
jgi:hypothetical protein